MNNTNTQTEKQSFLWLNQFPLNGRTFRLVGYLGGGSAGYVFKIRMESKTYALKMASQAFYGYITDTDFHQFKFCCPDVYLSKLKGMAKMAYYDSFVKECRANSRLISQGMNGIYSPFCYGWIEVPTDTEKAVAKKFHIPSFLWDRYPETEHDRVRGILFEYIRGDLLSQVPITLQTANDLRAGLQEIHRASIAHGDMRASNILVRDGHVRWIDFSASWSMPHVTISAARLEKLQENERLDLEVGFAFLSKVLTHSLFP